MIPEINQVDTPFMRFKPFEQVRIRKPGDRRHGYVALVTGYLTHGVCYVSLGERGPKDYQGNPIPLTYDERHLVSHCRIQVRFPDSTRSYGRGAWE